jgi:hypothetical protein
MTPFPASRRFLCWLRARAGIAAVVVCAGLPTRTSAADDIDIGPPPRPEPFVVFFPTIPPVYGAPVQPAMGTRSGMLNGRPLIAAEDLAEYVGEYFYPALGTQLFNRTLSAKLKARLDAYRAARNALRDELQAELVARPDADPDTRAQAAAALARVQTPRILALEAEAESLRHDLVAGGFFARAANWDEVREWHVGEPGVTRSPLAEDAEAQVVRAAPFYFDGLGIEQRGLLRELVFEFARKSRGAHAMRPGLDPTDHDVLFFSPAMARLTRPQPLPPDLKAKIAEFNAQKFVLQRELAAEVLENDRLSAAKRTSRLEALSARQWPRISTLETLAEDIRAGLAAIRPEPPSPPPLPADLAGRIDAFKADQRALLAAFNEVLRRAARPIGLPPNLGRMTSDERLQRIREQAQVGTDARRNAVAAFQLESAATIAALNQRFQKIRSDLAAVAARTTDPRTGRTMTPEALLAAYNVAMARFEAIGREEAMYVNYRFAMLQPGLSPAQRRLLFGAAHAGLALPLPGGEVVPAGRPHWLILP